MQIICKKSGKRSNMGDLYKNQCCKEEHIERNLSKIQGEIVIKSIINQAIKIGTPYNPANKKL